MTEEQLTITLLDFLESKGWEIISFDFPGSGTGRVLHPTSISNPSKTKGGIIPDIVAIKNGVCLFFENKDHYFQQDFQKQNSLKTDISYKNAITNLTKGKSVSKYYFGIGLPYNQSIKIKEADKLLVDFIVSVQSEEINVVYDSFGLYF